MSCSCHGPNCLRIATAQVLSEGERKVKSAAVVDSRRQPRSDPLLAVAGALRWHSLCSEEYLIRSIYRDISNKWEGEEIYYFILIDI